MSQTTSTTAQATSTGYPLAWSRDDFIDPITITYSALNLGLSSIALVLIAHRIWTSSSRFYYLMLFAALPIITADLSFILVIVELIGISDNELARVAGTGLGLSIASMLSAVRFRVFFHGRIFKFYSPTLSTCIIVFLAVNGAGNFVLLVSTYIPRAGYTIDDIHAPNSIRKYAVTIQIGISIITSFLLDAMSAVGVFRIRQRAMGLQSSEARQNDAKSACGGGGDGSVSLQPGGASPLGTSSYQLSSTATTDAGPTAVSTRSEYVVQVPLPPQQSQQPLQQQPLQQPPPRVSGVPAKKQRVRAAIRRERLLRITSHVLVALLMMFISITMGATLYQFSASLRGDQLANVLMRVYLVCTILEWILVVQLFSKAK
ncbi:hypothetical protein BC828DRAFT_378802 [Blastocladiella britannica]|nr:hypothetical protein BC828DRAFT_378802 [Blastocladiella britannica]